MPAQPLIFVTGNANKLREVKEILSAGGHPIKIVSQELDVPELQGTTQEVAREKCRRAAAMLGGPCITEDTALCFHALHGLPGVYIKHFLAALGHAGLNNMLAGFVDPATGAPDTRAWALCTFAYAAGPDAEPVLFEGRTDGHIVPARGPTNFGWDPVFQPVEGAGQTYAEMPAEAKNLISHRYRALDKLRDHLRTLGY